ncbi:Uncharacterised protein [Chlamydia trachomatis]|nr:Uncharacterised protein [Chlamydia trachomatis]
MIDRAVILEKFGGAVKKLITAARLPLREWSQQNAFNNKKKLTNY